MTRLVHERRLVTWLAPALLLGTLALAACGVTSTGGTSGGTPDAATIFQRAKAAKINDQTYTMSLTGTASGQTSTITINGKSTTDPKRDQLDMTANAAGTNLTFSMIEDSATSADYVKFSDAGALGLPTDKWFKITSSTAQSLSGGIGTLLDYSKMSNVKVVGTEQINGVTTWHLTATATFDATPTPGTATAGAQTATADLYFRQDNYYPVKIGFTSTGTDSANGTITWSAINSGISITLPDPSEVTTLPGA